MAGVSDLANLLQFALAVKNQFEQAVLNVRPRRTSYKPSLLATPCAHGTCSLCFPADRAPAALRACARRRRPACVTCAIGWRI